MKNLIISRYFDIDYYSQFNTTADYNIIKSFEHLKSKNNEEYIFLGINDFIKIYKNFNKYMDDNKLGIPNIVFINHTDEIIVNKLLDQNSQIMIYIYHIDTHSWSGFFNINHNNISRIILLLPYAYSYNIYNYKCEFKKILLPHLVVHPSKFNDNPQKYILVTGRGRRNESRYPNRVLMYNLSLTNPKVLYLQPTVEYKESIKDLENNKKMFGLNFIKELQNYLVCFCDDMSPSAPNIVAKFFEILSSGSLLLSTNDLTKKYFENLGFIDNIDYISMNQSNLIESINWVLDPENLDFVNKVRKSGYEKVWKYHDYLARAEQLDDILNNEHKNHIEIDDGIQSTKYYLYKINK